MGFSLHHGEVTLGLDALSVNDLTLWKSKITEAISTNSAVEKNFLNTQKSGNIHVPDDVIINSISPLFSP